MYRICLSAEKGYRKGFNNYYRGYVYLYDLDELWNVLMGEDWIWDKLQKWPFQNGLDMFKRYETYHEENKYNIGFGEDIDNSDFAFLMFYTKAVIGKGLIFPKRNR